MMATRLQFHLVYTTPSGKFSCYNDRFPTLSPPVNTLYLMMAKEVKVV